ncbi:MAG: hypothetical protein ACUVRE_08990 [Thermoanaerobaculaceae bacterium]
MWLLALVAQQMTQLQADKQLPQSQVYVVNGRKIADQATKVSIQIRQTPPKALPRIREMSVMGSLPSTQAAPIYRLFPAAHQQKASALLAVPTLRWELADNEEWRQDPARPAVNIGTMAKPLELLPSAFWPILRTIPVRLTSWLSSGKGRLMPRKGSTFTGRPTPPRFVPGVVKDGPI